jgi:hypothetical protein
MDFSTLLNNLQAVLGQHLPGIFGALSVLIIGWLLAVIVRAGLRRFLTVVGINKRISESTGQEVDVAASISFGAFIVIILVTLIGVFSSLNLQAVSEPFNVMVSQIFEYLPRLFAGIILLAIAWSIASIVRLVTTKALATTQLDEKLSKEAGMQPMSNNVGNMLFWIIILMFVPALLSTFELNGLLEPVQSMMNEFLGMLPNIFAAAIIAIVGWVVAKILRGLVTNILATAGIDNIGGAVGIKDAVKLSKVIGMLVFIFIFIPTLIAALDALNMQAISQPASDMLGMIFSAIPNIIAAAVILTITYYVAKFAASLVARLLESIGFNKVPALLGFSQTFKKVPVSDFIGKLIVFFAMLFATVEAANRLDFVEVRDIVSMFIQFGADILLGSVILIIGFWLANLAYEAVDRASGEKSKGLATVARLAILGLVIAMGLRAMGIADDIVNMAFGLTLGSVAVAVALAFGLGGREAAGKQLEYWFSKMRDHDQ